MASASRLPRRGRLTESDDTDPPGKLDCDRLIPIPDELDANRSRE